MPQEAQIIKSRYLGVENYLGLENAFKNIANFAILEVFFEKNFGEKNFFFKNLTPEILKIGQFEKFSISMNFELFLAPKKYFPDNSGATNRMVAISARFEAGNTFKMAYRKSGKKNQTFFSNIFFRVNMYKNSIPII